MVRKEGYFFTYYFQWTYLRATSQYCLDAKDNYDWGVVCLFEFAEVLNGFYV